jgi:tetratricopeptide (TPR) repeat protein
MSGRKLSSPSGRKNSAFSKKSLRPSVFQQLVLKEGYLEKQSSGAVKKWQSRYFEISGHYLNYYEKKEARSEQAVKGAFDLNHIREANAAGTAITIEVNDGSTVKLRGASEEVARLWVAEIKQVAGDLKATTADSDSAAGLQEGNSPVEQNQRREVQGNKKRQQKQREEMLARWEVKHAEESEEQWKERVDMLSKVEARWREPREKQAEMSQQQEEEEATLKEKIKEQMGLVKTLEVEEEGKIQRKVHQENAGKILSCAEGNDVVKYNLESFDPKDPRIGRMEGQYAGNHFTLAITLLGFIQLLSIIQWDDGKGNVLYKRDGTKFWDEKKNACWNTGPFNGYDVRQHVKEYLQKIGKLHQSLLEVIMEGKVEVLKCLQKHVGLADAFLSHVQALPIATMLETLEDAETRFAKELKADPVATVVLRKQALEKFLEVTAPKRWLRENGHCGDDAAAGARYLIQHSKGDWNQIEPWCLDLFRSWPDLTSIAAQKDTGVPKFFIDYCGIRQCLNSDFTIERVVGAIETIGTTVVELDADVLASEALLKRAFCVLESFATIKAKGVLLVCGPGLNDPAQMLKLAELASDGAACKAVMDSLSAKCRWEEEAVKIKAYIQRTVGFSRTDKVVLGAIVRCILGSAESVFAARADGGAAVLGALGWMVFEAGDYAAALGLLEAALAKGEAAHGPEAVEIADTVYRIGKCRGRIDGMAMEWFERDLRIQVKAHRSEEHASTARSLVGMGLTHSVNGDQAKGIECYERALRRIRAAARPEDYADDYADAMSQIGVAHFEKQEWREGLEWSRRSVEVREAKHGPDHALAAGALGDMAKVHGKLGDPEQAMALQLRVLRIDERAQGPLGFLAGVTCQDIGVTYDKKKKHAEAATWHKRALEAREFTYGPAHSGMQRCLNYFQMSISDMDPTDPKTKEHWQFLAASQERFVRALGGNGEGGWCTFSDDDY